MKARRNHVLRRMVAENYLKEADAKVFMSAPSASQGRMPWKRPSRPYAVEEVRKYLYEKYGKDAVLNGGLEVKAPPSIPPGRSPPTNPSGRAAGRGPAPGLPGKETVQAMNDPSRPSSRAGAASWRTATRSAG
ncbi:MAG: hypothetical protein IPL96_17890 [Holophagaceae bacterium]|nr:hypothetical protein [Holophagaceae bacterium]